MTTMILTPALSAVTSVRRYVRKTTGKILKRNLTKGKNSQQGLCLRNKAEKRRLEMSVLEILAGNG